MAEMAEVVVDIKSPEVPQAEATVKRITSVDMNAVIAIAVKDIYWDPSMLNRSVSTRFLHVLGDLIGPGSS